jgi:cysteine desulfuration protein SufE
MTIQEIQEEIIDEFDVFDDWIQKYDYLIELSKAVPLIDESDRVDENLIKGCQSKVWLHAKKEGDSVRFMADSDAIITKGIVALLVRVLDGQKCQDIMDNELHFIDAIGLKEHLSMTRSNGLVSMIKQMKIYALVFQAQ